MTNKVSNLEAGTGAASRESKVAQARPASDGGRAEAVLAILIPLVVFSVYTLKVTETFTAMPGSASDSLFNNSVLEHLYLWTTGVTADLWSPDYFYPYPDVLTFSDNHFGSGAIYVMFRSLGFSREAAFTAWHLAGYLASFLAMAWVLRRFGFSLVAASIGAVLFAFASTMLIRTEHSQLVYRFATPLAVYFTWRFLETGRLRHAGLMMVFAAWQVLCSIYVGVFLAMLLGAMGLALFARRDSRTLLFGFPARLLAKPSSTDLLLLAAGVLAISVAAAVLMRYASVAEVYGFSRDPALILSQLPSWDSYIRADNSRLYSGFAAGIKEDVYWHERQLFVGGVACFLMGMSFLKGHRNWRTAWGVLAIALVSLILFTLRGWPYGLTPYALVAEVPGFNAIRAPARIITVLLLPVGFMAAAGFDLLAAQMRRFGKLPQLGLGAACLAMIALETDATRLLTTPLSVQEARKKSVLDQMPASLPEDAVLAYRHRTDPDNPFLYSDMLAIVVAQELRLKTVNGYSGNFPAGWRQAETCGDLLPPLGGGAYYRQLSAAQLNDIVRRVVPVGFSAPCSFFPPGDTGFRYQSPDEMFSQDLLSKATPQNVTLSVLGVRPVDGHVDVQLQVHNNSRETLPGNFNAPRFNLRFSWRFSPKNAPLNPGDGWSTRASVYTSVEPGQSSIQTLSVPLPVEPGLYRVEVSMVQEEHMWFHDHGFLPARSENWIEIQ